MNDDSNNIQVLQYTTHSHTVCWSNNLKVHGHGQTHLYNCLLYTSDAADE